MADVYRKIIVDCMITAHASPRWKGARTEQQRVLQNELLARRRSEAVKKAIVEKLRAKLCDFSLEFVFDQSIVDDDSLPDGGVLVGAVSRGQNDSLIAAKGDRSNDDPLYRRVDIDVRIARKLDEAIPTEVVHAYKQATKSRFWYVSASAGIGLHVGPGVNVVFVELRDTYGRKATGIAYAAGAGVGVSGIGELISKMAKKDLLRAAVSASFGDEASFYTDKDVGWGDFHGRRIRYTSASIQIVAGYEWSYISFSNMGPGAQSIPVGGASLAADASASASIGVGLLYLFDVPNDWVIRRYTATEWHTHTSGWVTTHSLPLHFSTGSADLRSSMVELDRFTETVSRDFRDQ